MYHTPSLSKSQPRKWTTVFQSLGTTWPAHAHARCCLMANRAHAITRSTVCISTNKHEYARICIMMSVALLWQQFRIEPHTRHAITLLDQACVSAGYVSILHQQVDERGTACAIRLRAPQAPVPIVANRLAVGGNQRAQREWQRRSTRCVFCLVRCARGEVQRRQAGHVASHRSVVQPGGTAHAGKGGEQGRFVLG